MSHKRIYKKLVSTRWCFWYRSTYRSFPSYPSFEMMPRWSDAQRTSEKAPDGESSWNQVKRKVGHGRSTHRIHGLHALWNAGSNAK